MSTESHRLLVLAHKGTEVGKSPLDWPVSISLLGRVPGVRGFLEQRTIVQLVDQLMCKMVKEALEVGYTTDFRDDPHGHIGRNLYFMTRNPAGLIHGVTIGAHRSRYSNPTEPFLAEFYNRDILSLKVGGKEWEDPIALEVNKEVSLSVPEHNIKAQSQMQIHIWQYSRDLAWHKLTRVEQIAALKDLMSTVPDREATKEQYDAFAKFIAEGGAVGMFSNLRWCAAHQGDIFTTLGT